MQNKNIGGCVLSTQSDQQKKAPMQKCAKNTKKKKKIYIYQTLKKIFLARFAHSAFTKFIFLEQLTAMPQFNMQNMLLFFLRSHHATNSLLHLYHFRQKNIIIYWLILTMNHQGSYLPFFLVFIQWVKHFLYPSKLCNYLKHSAK